MENIVKIERSKLASMIILSEIALNSIPTDVERVKLANLINELRFHIKNHDLKVQEKEIGNKYNQQEMF